VGWLLVFVFGESKIPQLCYNVVFAQILGFLVSAFVCVFFSAKCCICSDRRGLLCLFFVGFDGRPWTQKLDRDTAVGIIN
jgi:hypothetical protein